MKAKIDCPMCSLVKLEEDICPNCGTNLWLYRILLRLPAEDTVKQNSRPKRAPILPLKMAIICIFMGIGLTTFVNSLLVGQKKPVLISSLSTSERILDKTPTSPQISLPTSSVERKEITEEEAQKSCGGLYYTVRQGNSLSLIASRFYGDGNFWQPIVTTNPQLQGREDLLNIGEVLLIPNLERYCTSEQTRSKS